ncbi:MAG: hypothetical protein WCG30_00580 [Candidatus Saccharibacteria bacterium]
MDDIANILNQSRLKAPDEISLIKDYILKKHNSSVVVSLKNDSIVISSGSSSLINELRLGSYELIKECKLDKKLVFKIG